MERTYEFSDYHRDKVPDGLRGRRFARNHTKIAGLQFRKADALAFLEGAMESDTRRWPYGIVLRREPHNSHDPLALAVDGFWSSKGFFGTKQNSLFVGYVPADWAKSYSSAADKGAMLAGLLKSCWTNDGGGIAIDIAIYRSID
jgi:hypothetical protein